MDEETGRRIASLIAGVICSDDSMSPGERSFLKRVLEGFGLETDIALIPTYGEDIVAELTKLPEATRWEALNLVIKAAKADGQIVPAERAYIDTVARELGLSEQDIVDRLQRAD